MFSNVKACTFDEFYWLDDIASGTPLSTRLRWFFDVHFIGVLASRTSTGRLDGLKLGLASIGGCTSMGSDRFMSMEPGLRRRHASRSFF